MTPERKVELLREVLSHVVAGKTVVQALATMTPGDSFAASEVLRTVIPDTAFIRRTKWYDEIHGMTTRIRMTWIRRALKRERLIVSRADKAKRDACPLLSL